MFKRFLSWISPELKYRFKVQRLSDVGLASQICKHEMARLGQLHEVASHIGEQESIARRMAVSCLSRLDMELNELSNEMKRRNWVSESKVSA